MAGSSRGYVSAGPDPYLLHDRSPVVLPAVVASAVIVLVLGAGPVAFVAATGGHVGDAVVGCGLLCAIAVGRFGWIAYDVRKSSPDNVRLAIDAAGIYLQGGHAPAWQPGRIPWPDVAEVVLSTRHTVLPSGTYLHIEVRRSGKPRGPSVIGDPAHADEIAAAVHRHAPGIPVTR